MQSDFRKFLWYVWIHTLLLPAPTRVQYDIANFLATGPRRRMIMAFRGVGKSFITAAYIVWRLWKDPDLKIMVVSANGDFAAEIASFIRLLIHSIPFLEELKARADQKDSSLIFDVGPAKPDKSPSVKAVGIFGQLTGSRADIVLFDDVEVPKNSETEAMREKLAEKTKEAAAVLKPGGEVIYLGTPQSAESTYSGLPGKGYTIRVWTGRYPLRKNLIHYEGTLAPLLLADIEENPDLCEPAHGSTLGGAPTDPDRFDEIDLMEREAEYAASGFTLQYMLDTRLSDAERYPLKLKDLIVMDVDREVGPLRAVWASGPEQWLKDLPNVGFAGDRYCQPMHVSRDFAKYTGAVMVIDPSGKGKDETAYAVTKTLNGMVYLRRCGGLRGGYTPDVLQALAKVAEEEQVNKILVEENFGGGMFVALLKPVLNAIYPCSMEEYRSTGQKEVRILDKLEPVVGQHRLVVDKTLIEEDFRSTDENAYRLFYQLTHLTRDRGSLKHDDRIEVVAEAVAYWMRQLRQDVEQAAEAHSQKLLEAELKKFLEAARRKGGKGTGRSFTGRRGRGRRRRR